MKIYVATYNSGGVIAAGQVEAKVRAQVEKLFPAYDEFEWREDGGRQHRLYRRRTNGRWNSIPARYIQAVDADIDECNYDCDRCKPWEPDNEEYEG